jgi:hypothetical protein
LFLVGLVARSNEEEPMVTVTPSGKSLGAHATDIDLAEPLLTS